MTAKIHWFLPTTGDGRTLVGGGHVVPTGLGDPRRGSGGASQFRRPDIDYLAAIARAADQLGFEGVLTPTGSNCEDAWVTTAALIRETQRLKFLVAFRPGLTNPVMAANMAASFQRISDGRLLLNVVTGGEPAEQARFGDVTLSKEDRYARSAEFLTVVRGAWQGGFDFSGDHYEVTNASVFEAPSPVPDLYFGGSSSAAGPVAADHCDVYLTWGEPFEHVREKTAWVRRLAEQRGRTMRFGIRMHVITRDSSQQAWDHAQWLLDHLDPDHVAAAQAGMQASESEGQRRMRALHVGKVATSAHDLEIDRNLWAGVGLVRGGAGTALVGSHEDVAERIAELVDLGIDEFILSGYPHLEEAWWFGEGVRPILDRWGVTTTQRDIARPQLVAAGL